MLKFYVRHGIMLDKISEIVSFAHILWLEKYISFNTQKGNKAENEFEKDFYELLNNAFYGKTMRNVQNCLRLEFTEKYEYLKFIKQKSKLTFNGNHKSYENCDIYSFNQIEVRMVKLFY